jgi:hypothetical protein
MEAPRKKGKTGWNLVCHQNWWFWWVWSPIECQCTFFGRFLLNLTLCMMTKLRVLVLYFSYFMDKLYYGVLSLKLSDHLRSWYWVQVWIFSRYIYIYIYTWYIETILLDLYKAGINSPPYMGNNIRINLVLHQLIPDW